MIDNVVYLLFFLSFYLVRLNLWVKIVFLVYFISIIYMESGSEQSGGEIAFTNKLPTLHYKMQTTQARWANTSPWLTGVLVFFQPWTFFFPSLHHWAMLCSSLLLVRRLPFIRQQNFCFDVWQSGWAFCWPFFRTSFCARHYGANSQDELSGFGQRTHRYRRFILCTISVLSQFKSYICPLFSPGHYQKWIYDFLCSDWLTQNQNIA